MTKSFHIVFDCNCYITKADNRKEKSFCESNKFKTQAKKKMVPQIAIFFLCYKIVIILKVIKMFEEYTFEVILNAMLARVPDTIDKRQGSIVYNALAPAAVELQNMYINLDVILNETFADTASREYLIKRAEERGITPYPATHCIVKAEITPSSLELSIGERFSLDKFNYIVTEKISDGNYKLQCEEAGAEPSYVLGQLIPINYIQGLEYAEITEILIPGEDEESTEDFRKRYFLSVQTEAFGGNVIDYKYKTKSIDGVGGVKVYPVWNGGGTVKLVIQNSLFQQPSLTLIDQVQTIIDPVQNSGTGLGIAPIGHVVTVVGVGVEDIDIVSEITLQDGYVWDDVKNLAEQTINQYLLELNSDWENQNNIIVRISQIETHLLNVSGIIDVADTEINNVAENYQAQANNIVALNSLSPA